ncbi:MAG: DUF4386 domain-containing protein [Candidatus Microbacterium phytovorans]|uniref:DUF4386 domain-containing protein n=1 Tax=Candidatus Microbacterium phytovorans TaxID=3121374 RepID=A0AAJ5VXZ7_9MICO|nr:DUF4386 domain-containing protein [Microbacterium sp.]WEK12446.1 MAG: DUF4386 domain-containing protein [Microbacterium sp.]
MTDRRLARTAGILYLLTFATSIPALALKSPVLAGSTAADAATLARAGALLEVVLAVACVGTAVALFPLLRRAVPALALGFVASRVLEAGLVLLGIAALLVVVTTGDPAAVALHDAAFLLGPGLLPAVNALLLGTALLRTRLVPRLIPVVGLIGAPLLLVSAGATLLGVFDQVSPVAALLALPIAVWEFALGVWLTVRAVPGTPRRSPSQRRGAPVLS